jgi:hypothetical protein
MEDDAGDVENQYYKAKCELRTIVSTISQRVSAHVT